MSEIPGRGHWAASRRCLGCRSILEPGVLGCDLVHIPGSRSLSVLLATGDDFEVSQQTLTHAFQSAGWTSEPGILDVLVFSHTGPSNTARVIWGPDPDGLLSTGFMLSIDLPEDALSELPQ